MRFTFALEPTPALSFRSSPQHKVFPSKWQGWYRRLVGIPALPRDLLVSDEIEIEILSRIFGISEDKRSVI